MKSRQTGFTLLESMIALLILSIGLLGIASLQLYGLQSSQSSFQRSVAISQASDLAERLWGDICTLPDAANDIRDAWRDEHQNGALPGWQGDLDLTSDTGVTPYRFEISVQWDSRMNADSNPTERFVYLVVIPAMNNCTAP